MFKVIKSRLKLSYVIWTMDCIFVCKNKLFQQQTKNYVTSV